MNDYLRFGIIVIEKLIAEDLGMEYLIEDWLKLGMSILSLKTIIILFLFDFFNVCLFTFMVLDNATFCYPNRL